MPKPKLTTIPTARLAIPEPESIPVFDDWELFNVTPVRELLKAGARLAQIVQADAVAQREAGGDCIGEVYALLQWSRAVRKCDE